MQILECLFIAYNAVEVWGLASGHQASPVFTIILIFLNISHTLLVQPIGDFYINFIECMGNMRFMTEKCPVFGLFAETDMYTEHLLLSKTDT